MPAQPAEARPHATHRATNPRILIVDDSVVARAVISRMLTANKRFDIAAAVANAHLALAFLATNKVDAILLDIDMPGVDGLSALPDLLVAGAGAQILIVSSSCDEGAATTVQALALGAADTLVKPGIGAFAGRFSEVLTDKLARLLAAEPAAPAPLPLTPEPGPGSGFDIVAIGASTGGIHALSLLLREIPATFPLPILITQHLPESFMPYFAAQVAVLAGRPCDVASDHLRIRPGRVIVAPGNAHMRVVSIGDGAAIRLSKEAVSSGCMPSVDPMFESLAEVFGTRALGIVLSGMGRDGCDGARVLLDAGGHIVVQDQESSVVWGMPGAIASSGRASMMLPPSEIGKLVASRKRPAC